MVFEKPLDEIDEEDILRLGAEEIEEGILLDYKSDWVDNKKLAKAVASFANTHGGHLILGVSADKLKNVPMSVTGVEERDGIKERVANVCKSRIHPLPFFRMKLVKLREMTGRCVLVIEVPESYEPPHYVNGVIYVRNGESSDPVEPLKNHFVIEKLYEKRESGEHRVGLLVAKRGLGEEFKKADYSLSLITCPSIPGRVPLPVYKRDFYQLLKDTWGFPGEDIDRSSIRLRNKSRWKERYTEVCVNGLIEQGRGVCFPQRSEGVIQGSRLLHDDFPEMLRNSLRIYRNTLVQYYGRLQLFLTVNGTAGRSLCIDDCDTFPAGCQSNSVRMSREGSVHDLDSKTRVRRLCESFERELRRAFGELVFEPE